MYRVAEHAKRTDTGRRRSGNEDSHYVRVPLFVLADGMGGAQAGEVASQLTIDVFRAGLPDRDGSIEERLERLIDAANLRVYDEAAADDRLTGMGTTCTAAYLGPHDLALAHVGDSRAYCWRDGTLRQLTDDHSLVGELVRRGQLSVEEAEDHPQRSIITRALGQERQIPIDHHTWPVADGDVYLLCSDGLTDMVPDRMLTELIAQGGALHEIADRLVAQANRAGGRDNITVLLFRVEEVERDAGAEDEDDPITSAMEAVTASGRAAAAGSRSDGAVAPATVAGAAVRPAATDPGRARATQAPSPPARTKRRVPAAIKLVIALLVVVVVIGSGAWIGTRSMYFVGANDEGFVTLYQGIPYDLPLLPFYQQKYVSGLPAASLTGRARSVVHAHELRSQDDAADLIRQLERGTVGGSP